MVRRLALVVAYGPEARAFLQSGLAERLSRHWEVAIVSAEPGSAAFTGRPEPVLPLPCRNEGAAMLRARAWGRGARRRVPPLAPLFLQLERAVGRQLGGGVWQRFFFDHSIDAVVTASATGGRTLPALQAASNAGLPSVVLLNSWKDLRRGGELPARVAAVGVVAPDNLRALPADLAHVALCGSLHQAALRRASAMSREAFCAALGLDPLRPILCYATAMRDAEELARLDWLAGRLGSLTASPQLLIRLNPMCEDASPYEALALRPGVALLRPRWEWSRERDWCCPLPADLPWWRAALEHASAAITLPSTITLDFAAWGKPTVNVAWGAGAPPWSAPSYAGIRGRAGTLAASSRERLLSLLDDLLRDPPRLKLDADDPVNAAAGLIERACGQRAQTNAYSQEAVAR